MVIEVLKKCFHSALTDFSQLVQNKACGEQLDVSLQQLPQRLLRRTRAAHTKAAAGRYAQRSSPVPDLPPGLWRRCGRPSTLRSLSAEGSVYRHTSSGSLLLTIAWMNVPSSSTL